ncbi:predicted protein [Nematostella vectensis]|uniref:AAA+ ATPase domain-containing protein n=1 Tax=Nematostella vectensis TaxID=45351 RepID=A7SXZ8_NEMVE|nr:predicted protein [Nematostella vectensis]|eukprot:XP_001623528.1 predicted protein [Nematostella vectensis]
MPLQFPHLFTGGRKPWRRVLLYGPPGTGKTRLAQAVASEVNSTFYSVSSADLISSWVGESEKLIRELFHDARKREGRSVIFIDEIDSVCRKRSTREEEHTRRVKTELLNQMEGTDSLSLSGQYFLLCATNCPWELDSAFIRRFQKRIYIPLPEQDARISLIKMHLGTTPACLTERDWCVLGEKTRGFSGSDLANCTSDAVFEPVRELQRSTHWKQQAGKSAPPCSEGEPGCVTCLLKDLPPQKVTPRPVVLEDFIRSLSHNGSTITDEDLDKFTVFTKSYGQKG